MFFGHFDNGEEQGWLHACGRVVQQKPMICSGGPFTAAVLHLAEIVFGVFFGRAEAATNTAARRRIQTDFDLTIRRCPSALKCLGMEPPTPPPALRLLRWSLVVSTAVQGRLRVAAPPPCLAPGSCAQGRLLENRRCVLTPTTPWGESCFNELERVLSDLLLRAGKEKKRSSKVLAYIQQQKQQQG